MKIRLLLQIGAYHKTKADPDADFLQLSQSLESILDWATLNGSGFVIRSYLD